MGAARLLRPASRTGGTGGGAGAAGAEEGGGGGGGGGDQRAAPAAGRGPPPRPAQGRDARCVFGLTRSLKLRVLLKAFLSVFRALCRDERPRTAHVDVQWRVAVAVFEAAYRAARFQLTQHKHSLARRTAASRHRTCCHIR
eukprot:640443-Rhodomonas_salina.2